jgi:hypothetical protein
LTRFHGEEEPEKSELPALQIIRRSFQLPSGTGNTKNQSNHAILRVENTTFRKSHLNGS